MKFHVDQMVQTLIFPSLPIALHQRLNSIGVGLSVWNKDQRSISGLASRRMSVPMSVITDRKTDGEGEIFICK